MSSAAPWKARLIFDRDGGRGESVRGDCDKLKKGLQPVERAQRCRSGEFRTGIGDSQFVGFIFAELLDRFAAVIGMNVERGGCPRLGPKRNAGLSGKLRRKALDVVIERSFVRTGHGHGEMIA